MKNKRNLPAIQKKALPVARSDGWGNVITGMGQANIDRKEQTTFSAEFRLMEVLCRNLYTYSGLARSIADLPVGDGLRKWFTIEGDTDNLLESECKRLHVKQKTTEAWRWARVYGGSIIVMMANDGGKLDEPLNETNIQNIEKLKVYHRWKTSRSTWYLDPNDPKYAETELYMISPVQQMTTSFLVHESRCLIFDGCDVAPEIRQGNQWWGDSAYQAIYQRLRGLGEAFNNVEHIIGEFLLMITKIKGLAMKIAEGKEQEIVQRAIVNNMTRHLMGSYMLDADGEDASRISASVSGLDTLMDTLMMAVSAETRIPVRKLFGSPIQASGLGNDGDSEITDYDQFVIAERDDHVQEPMERLVKLLQLQKQGVFKGREIPNWKIKWAPLKEETLTQQLANKKVQSDIDRNSFDMGVLHPEEIRQSRHGSDTYSYDTKLLPGLDAVDVEEMDVNKGADKGVD